MGNARKGTGDGLGIRLRRASETILEPDVDDLTTSDTDGNPGHAWDSPNGEPPSDLAAGVSLAVSAQPTLIVARRPCIAVPK